MMKKALKVLGISTVIFLVAATLFGWAISSTLDDEDFEETDLFY